MEAKELRYALDAMVDYGRVLNGIKPLLIVSAEKSKDAYDTVGEMAWDNPRMFSCFAMLSGEDGELHEHVFVCRDGAPYASEALSLIFDAVNQTVITREQLQIRLGALLGYSSAQCLQFSRSLVGLTCECDCCGGPPQKLLKHMPVKSDAGRRTQYYYDPATDA